MDDSVVIALFRHGLTEANKNRAYLGWSDSPLCPIEKEKIQRPMAEYECLFSSDLDRCLETSSIMFPGCDPQILYELREMNFGEWEGKTYEDLQGDADYQKWLAEPNLFKPPNGESFSEFLIRIERGWEEVVKRLSESNMKKVAMMTHGGVIRALLTKFAPEKKDFWEWEVMHGKGYELVWNLDGLRRGERCTLLREVPLMVNRNG